MNPHMDESLSLRIIDGRESELAQHDGSIAHDGTSDLNQILLKIEVD